MAWSGRLGRDEARAEKAKGVKASPPPARVNPFQPPAQRASDQPTVDPSDSASPNQPAAPGSDSPSSAPVFSDAARRAQGVSAPTSAGAGSAGIADLAPPTAPPGRFTAIPEDPPTADGRDVESPDTASPDTASSDTSSSDAAPSDPAPSDRAPSDASGEELAAGVVQFETVASDSSASDASTSDASATVSEPTAVAAAPTAVAAASAELDALRSQIASLQDSIDELSSRPSVETIEPEYLGASKTLRYAQQTADAIIADARTRSEELVADAQRQRTLIIRQGREQAEAEFGEERDRVRGEAAAWEARRAELFEELASLTAVIGRYHDGLRSLEDHLDGAVETLKGGVDAPQTEADAPQADGDAEAEADSVAHEVGDDVVATTDEADGSELDERKAATDDSAASSASSASMTPPPVPGAFLGESESTRADGPAARFSTD